MLAWRCGYYFEAGVLEILIVEEGSIQEFILVISKSKLMTARESCRGVVDVGVKTILNFQIAICVG